MSSSIVFKQKSIPMATIGLFILLSFSSSQLQAKELTRQGLFHIARNHNANIIQYDAQIGRDGKLDARDPVVAYWIRLAEEGQEKELSWVQRKFAYGFKAKYHAGEDKAVLKMAAKIGRKIRVGITGGRYRAITEISGRPAYIESIYISAHGKGLSGKVDYIEFHGIDTETGAICFEHYVL